MATVANTTYSHEVSDHLRPLDSRRDLLAVADLIEVCFADTLDSEGRRYLQNMRAAAQNPGIAFFAPFEEWTNVPISGFVWEEDQRLVGNISLIPYRLKGQRQYLIANVAVHPDFRRRGIGRLLTEQGIEYARMRGMPDVWLHVREENSPAITLYQELGFEEQARRTTWVSSTAYQPSPLPDGVKISRRRPDIWQIQETWLLESYPLELRWNLPLWDNALRPGIAGAFYRFSKALFVQQWAAWQNKELIGVLACQSTYTRSNILWLASKAGRHEIAAQALLHHARQDLGSRRHLVLDYPRQYARQAIETAGFREHQTLIWMQKVLKTTP
jgi:ribosomal protein S18 acetylase RimI-like enzyme